MKSEGSRLLGKVEMTRREAARVVGVSHATIGAWISGERIPKLDHRRALAKALQIPESSWPAERTDDWPAVRDLVVRLISERAPDLLPELVARLESLRAHP